MTLRIVCIRGLRTSSFLIIIKAANKTDFLALFINYLSALIKNADFSISCFLYIYLKKIKHYQGISKRILHIFHINKKFLVSFGTENWRLNNRFALKVDSGKETG